MSKKKQNKKLLRTINRKKNPGKSQDSIEKINANPIDSKNESSFYKWLKYSLQVLALIVSGFGAFYAYKSYSYTQPVQIKLEYFGINKDYALSNDLLFLVLEQTAYNRIVLGTASGPDIWHTGLLFPKICNHSNKSIKNFNLKVEAQVSPFTYISYTNDNINQDFFISRKDASSAVFEYKYDVLYANSSVSSPLNEIMISDTTKTGEDFYQLVFNYSITYDGIPEPIHYTVLLFAYIDDSYKHYLDVTVGHFLDRTKTIICSKDAALISLCDMNIPIEVVDLLDKHITNEDFEEFKLNIVKSYKL